MNPPWFEAFLALSSNLLQKPLSMENLKDLPAHELLSLANLLEDEHIPLLMMILKSFGPEAGIFEKLMGEHEEENRILVDQFFERYSEQVMADLYMEDINPLSLYLPPDTWLDLVFLESRKEFFLRQKMDTILSYLKDHFSETPELQIGEQEEAWSWFWLQILQK